MNLLKTFYYCFHVALIVLAVILISSYENDKAQLDKLSNNHCYISNTTIYTEHGLHNTNYVLIGNATYVQESDSEVYSDRIFIGRKSNLESIQRLQLIHQNSWSECYTDKSTVYIKSPKIDKTSLSVGIIWLLVCVPSLIMLMYMDIRDYRSTYRSIV